MIRRRGRAGKRTSKRRKSRLALRKECDKRFALAVKQRDGWKCVICGRGNVQCAHIVSRRYHSTRWLLGNAVALCPAHHVFYTHRPLEWDEWVTARLGEAGYQELRAIALRSLPWVDYEAVLASLPAVEGS